MRKRKLYYAPGLISLLGLPVLLYFLGPQDPAIQTAIKIYLPSDDTKPDPPGIVRLTRNYVYRSLKHRKIVEVDLGDPDQEIEELYRIRHLKKLDFIANEIGRRQFTHDTSSVFKIQLGYDCTYGDLISVLNQVRLYDVKRYVFIDDAYYLFPPLPPPPEPIHEIRLDPINDFVYSPEPVINNEPSQWELFKVAFAAWWEKAILIIKRNHIYVLGFLLLIMIPAIVRLHKKIFPNPKKTFIFRKTSWFMKFLSLAPFVPSGGKYEESKHLFQELGFTLNWDAGGMAGFAADGCNFILQNFDRKEFAENFMLSVRVSSAGEFRNMVLEKKLPERFGIRIGQVTQQPYGKEVNIIDIAGVCWHFVE